jgi:hypothetical protein
VVVTAEIAATAEIAGNRLASRRASQASLCIRRFPKGSPVQFLHGCPP